MAAPCALAISKLSYPETEESPFKSEGNIKVACGCVSVPWFILFPLMIFILLWFNYFFFFFF